MKRISYATYPMAFFNPGGGEVQLNSYAKYIEELGIEVDKYNMWEPKIKNGDYIHFFSCIPGSNIFLDAIRNKGVGVFVSPNLWITKKTINDYPHEEIRNVLRLADRIICNSKAEAINLAEIFEIDSEKFHVVYNGIDDKFFERKKTGIDFCERFNLDAYEYVLCVGNIEVRKNQKNLAWACKNLKLKLVLVGGVRDQHYLNECKQIYPELIHVEYLPPHSDYLMDAYSKCKVFVLPSKLETPGIAALEAAALGAQVVITSEGCTREYFCDFAEYIDPNDIKSIENGINNALLKNNNNLNVPENFFKKFKWSNVVGNLVDCYMDRILFPKPLIHSGFYLSEHDGFDRFAWGTDNAVIENIDSDISFELRLPVNGIVKISELSSTRDICLLKDQWEKIVVSKKNDDLSKISFSVEFHEKFQHKDHRNLRFSIKNLKVKQHENIN